MATTSANTGIYPDEADYSTFASNETFELGGRRYYGGAADMDLSWTLINGPRAVLEHIARRLISPPGSYDDPEYGFDLNSYLNANLLPQELDSLQAAVRDQALSVEGVDDCVVTASLLNNQLVVEIDVTLTESSEGYNMVFVLGPDTIPRIYFPTTQATIV